MNRRSFISDDDQGGMSRRDFIAGAASVPLAASIPLPVVAEPVREHIGWSGVGDGLVMFTAGRAAPTDHPFYSDCEWQPVYAT